MQLADSQWNNKKRSARFRALLFYLKFSKSTHSAAEYQGRPGLQRLDLVDGILVIPFLFHGEGVLPALFFGHVGKFGFFHKFFEIRVIPKQLGLLDGG